MSQPAKGKPQLSASLTRAVCSPDPMENNHSCGQVLVVKRQAPRHLAPATEQETSACFTDYSSRSTAHVMHDGR